VKVIAFYSFKGGVGRSLAAANFAVYLGRLGLKIVIIDLNLEAPSLVEKLHLDMNHDQKGVLSYLLSFRKSSSPESVESYLVPVAIKGERISYETTIWLMPAGYWPSSKYQQELSELDWNAVITTKKSENPVGALLDQIRALLEPDYVVIDSRGGLSEAKSAINLDLADEIVIFSPLSNENVDAINQLSVIIGKESSHRESGGKASIKIVFSRVPNASNVENLRRNCLSRLGDTKEAGIDSSSIFFLASCKQLEYTDKLVLIEPTDNPDVERLVSDYVLLFSGLVPNLSEKVISDALNKMNNRLLALSNPDDAEGLISQFAGLAPHPEVYRWAMRNLRARSNVAGVSKYALKLITMLPDDLEALNEVARVYPMLPPGEHVKWHDKVISTFEALYKAGKLDEKSCLQFAKLLKDANALDDALRIVTPLIHSEKLSAEERADAKSIALLAAVRLERMSLITEMVNDLDRPSIQALWTETAIHLMAWCHDHHTNSTLALEIGLRLAQNGELDVSKGLITLDRLEKIVHSLTKSAGDARRLEELERAFISGTIAPMKRQKQSKEYLEQLARIFSQAGLPKSASEIQQLLEDLTHP